MKPHVLIVGGWNEILQKAAALPLTFVLFQKAELLTDLQVNLAQHVSVFDYGDSARAVEHAESLHRVRPFDAVVSFTEYGLEPAARIAERLGVRGNPLRPVTLTRDKVQMRVLMQEAGFTPVQFRVCRDAAEALAFLEQVGGPIILKPVLGSGSEGVARVDDPAELDRAWAWAAGAAGGPVMAEEFLDGPEYSVEALTLGGVHQVLAITEKATTGHPHFVETGHRMPAPLPDYTRQAIAEYIESFLQLIGHQVGPSHTEIRLTSRGPRIIESHTRAGGDRIWEMVELTTGVDLISTTLRDLVLGGAAFDPVALQRAAAIRFFAHEPGVVRRITGLDEAAAVPGIVRVVCRVRPGDRVDALASSDSRPGYMLAVGATLDEADDHLETAWRLVHFHVEREVSP
ncbi:MAG TPA: ATP-grasp domain-containing protein [Symbiobacteriaceae bacterium]|nr:ATP-grasp domain-containing protein [Symbiobacteriaceae bacterium]